MEITLSGGNFGGEIIIWNKTDILEDGREYMDIEGFIYALVGNVAVFYGMA